MVNKRSIFVRNALWLPNLVEEPMTRALASGVKGHAGVSQCQPKVDFLTNALWLPN